MMTIMIIMIIIITMGSESEYQVPAQNKRGAEANTRDPAGSFNYLRSLGTLGTLP